MDVKTYNPKKVIIALGSHVVSGYADDSLSPLNLLETEQQ